MPHLQKAVTCRVLVDNNELRHDISSVRLEQYIDDHHVARVRLRGVGEGREGTVIEDPSRFSAMLGKPATIEMENLEFVGIVTEATFDNTIDAINSVILTVHSPTITMDGGARNDIFVDQSASDVIESTVRRYPVTLGNVDSISGQMPYHVQYRETDWHLVMRLANGAGKFAYYTGREFRVSDPSSSDSDELGWPENLGAFSYGLGTVADKLSSQAYDEASKSVWDSASTGSLRTSLSGLAADAHNASGEVFPDAHFLGTLAPGSQAGLDKAMETGRHSRVGEMITCRGESTVSSVAIGRAIQVNGMGGLDGSFWVTAVTHVFDESGKYHNEFTCTPLDTAFPGRKYIRPAYTDLQSGLVTDTSDPDDQGRVKVKFFWNRRDGSEAVAEKWLRVMTLHAGAEKGTFWLPEVDDEVLIGFTHGNPDRPVILGTLYNAVDKPPQASHSAGWNAADNDLKVIRTKAGNEIFFSDASGSETLSIVQKDGTNMVTLSMSGPSITIQSDGDIEIKGANINIESTSGDIKLKAAGKLAAEGGSDVEIKAAANFKSEGGANYEAKGGAQAKLSSANTTVEGSGMLTVKGALVKIN